MVIIDWIIEPVRKIPEALPHCQPMTVIHAGHKSKLPSQKALWYTCLPVIYDRDFCQRLLANSETQKYCPAELGVLNKSLSALFKQTIFNTHIELISASDAVMNREPMADQTSVLYSSALYSLDWGITTNKTKRAKHIHQLGEFGYCWATWIPRYLDDIVSHISCRPRLEDFTLCPNITLSVSYLAVQNWKTYMQPKAISENCRNTLWSKPISIMPSLNHASMELKLTLISCVIPILRTSLRSSGDPRSSTAVCGICVVSASWAQSGR